MPLMERRRGVEPHLSGPSRCHVGEFCFFQDENFEGNMLYGTDRGGNCGGGAGGQRFVGSSGLDLTNQVSSWVNNTDYTIYVYASNPPNTTTSVPIGLWRMYNYHSNSFVGSEANDRNGSFCVEGGNCPEPCPRPPI
jgi:hypothetical protein